MVNTNINILVIEDEEDIRDLICMQLKLQGFSVNCAENYQQAKEQYTQNTYQLFLIDRMLPDNNGISIVKELRSMDQYKETSIIIVTALTQPENIIEGLDAGADDYITKPFDIHVLKARVRTQLKKLNSKNKKSSNVFEIENLKVDYEKCKVKVHGETTSLTSTEYKILVMLTQEVGVVLTRERLIKHVIGDDVFVTNRTIDTHIAGLRKKLGPAANLIETMRGIGYRFQDNE